MAGKCNLRGKEMQITGYQERKPWHAVRRKNDEGRLTILTLLRGQKTKTWKKIYNSNLQLLDRMVKQVAMHATRFSKQNPDDYVFGYREDQLNSILVPAFWHIVGKRKGLVLIQCPTRRKAMKYALSGKEKPKERVGWADYRLRSLETSYALELKLVSSNEDLGNKGRIIKEWNDAFDKLSRIYYNKQIANLGLESSSLFKSAILFIPIFIHANSEELHLLSIKDASEIDTLLTDKLNVLLAEFKPEKKRPDWIACWLLPDWLQASWQDDKIQSKHWHTPAVLIFAKLCEKWEKDDKGKWTRVSKYTEL
jgi:hypothetical protein